MSFVTLRRLGLAIEAANDPALSSLLDEAQKALCFATAQRNALLDGVLDAHRRFTTCLSDIARGDRVDASDQMHYGIAHAIDALAIVGVDLRTEVLHWKSPDASMPDAERTVLLVLPPGHAEPVWPGWFDGHDDAGKEVWRLVDGSELRARPLLWTDIPEGPLGARDE